MDISKLLTFTAKEGASDCHISAGEPPMIRMNGDLKKLDHPVLTTEETHSLIYDMMSDTQRKNFEEKRECDFSFELGDIARFRVNVFVQSRGLGAVTQFKGKIAFAFFLKILPLGIAHHVIDQRVCFFCGQDRMIELL